MENHDGDSGRAGSGAASRAGRAGSERLDQRRPREGGRQRSGDDPGLPRRVTLAEAADTGEARRGFFGWTPGTLAAIGEELLDAPTSETVGAAPEDEDTLLFRRPEGLSDMEWAAMQRAMRGGWEWEIRKAARER